jgi:hypothetical protein
MALVRFLGLMFVVIGLMLLGADCVSTLEMPGSLVVRSLERILMLLQIDAKTYVELNFEPWLASPSLAILATPASAVFGLLGILLWLLGLAGHREPAPASKAPPIHR